MDKKTVFAFGLIIMVIILLPYYYKMVMPPQEITDVAQEYTQSFRADSITASTPPRDLSPEPAQVEIFSEAVGGGGEELLDTGGFLREENPEQVFVETPLYNLAFSTRGGVLVGASLYNYKDMNGESVQIVREGSDDNLNVTIFAHGSIVDTRHLRFSPDKRELFIDESGEGSLTLRAESHNGSWITKRFVFRGDEYQFRMKLEAGSIAGLDPYYEVEWGSGLAITEADTAQDIYYSEAYAYMGGELETFKGKGDKDLSGQASGRTEWIAQRNKYFEVAILPLNQEANGVRFGIEAQPKMGKHRPKVYRTVLRMDGLLSQGGGEFTIFCGPIDQNILNSVNPYLEETMNWGWAVIEPFSKAILWSLKALHKVIPNYGLVLIIFSILVKIVVWPLTHKSTKSMSRMSALQPKIKELQEKYKGTPEKMNKAMMNLYKEEGVNPFSSCWPTMLQMPLLYALFIIFRSTIELRQAPFIFWITDLSAPDIITHLPFSIPLYGSHIALLPIFMGATQMLMSKVMITDPKQKATMYMMPVFMVLIFNNFPSGLSLYYALFNLWTYLQQTYLKKKDENPVQAATK